MTKRNFYVSFLAALTCILTLAATNRAMAEMVVIDQSATAYKTGMKLADDIMLDLPKGAWLKLLKQSDGITHSLKGPYKGTLTGYANRPKTMWEKLFGSKATKRSYPPVGGTRGAAPAPPMGGTRDAAQPPPIGGTRGIN